MRSLRDEAQSGQAGAHTAVGGTVGDAGSEGVGGGTASLRWKPPVDQGEVRSFLT